MLNNLVVFKQKCIDYGHFMVFFQYNLCIFVWIQHLWGAFEAGLYLKPCYNKSSKLAHDKIYNSSTSGNSDWPAHPLRVFADCMCLLQLPNYWKRDEREPFAYWGGMYRLIWVFAIYTGLIVGFVVRWLVSPRFLCQFVSFWWKNVHKYWLTA